jgi:SAM-dependent methyltransferase
MVRTRELVPPREILPSYAHNSNYRRAGRRFRRAAIKHGLRPEHRVLELGCGAGRFAVAMAGHLSDRGSYIGVDTARRSIEICDEWIASKVPDFEFVWADLYNARYNPTGQIRAADFRFPCEDESIDFAFSNSLFTHLLPGDTAHYLAELGRVLKPGGRTLNTIFILNDEAHALLKDQGSGHGKLHRFEAVSWIKDRKQPERWIGFDEAFLRTAHAAAGLRVEEIVHGQWPGRDAPGIGFGKKDAIVAVKL